MKTQAQLLEKARLRRIYMNVRLSMAASIERGRLFLTSFQRWLVGDEGTSPSRFVHWMQNDHPPGTFRALHVEDIFTKGGPPDGIVRLIEASQRIRTRLNLQDADLLAAIDVEAVFDVDARWHANSRDAFHGNLSRIARQAGALADSGKLDPDLEAQARQLQTVALLRLLGV